MRVPHSLPRRLACIALILLGISVGFASPGLDDSVTEPGDLSQQEDSPGAGLNAAKIEDRLEGDFDSRDIAAATSWAGSLGIADWLEPLAPWRTLETLRFQVGDWERSSQAYKMAEC
ncbi:hypothetical protein Q31b_07760 [Novipirellula aureliae]|uniref:Uncharacterized protein n=1 Tax=Novipirellula aureliae TaxID=2527966 RepID=A0A5C6ED15_9BACT|nr:hypothetical protein [Novipirellula aureliae]TWU45601.1 hypothetical protein Q31b_07760 [Novipirellula aureliae]